jgi:hypothetical protein
MSNKLYLMWMPWLIKVWGLVGHVVYLRPITHRDVDEDHKVGHILKLNESQGGGTIQMRRIVCQEKSKFMCCIDLCAMRYFVQT